MTSAFPLLFCIPFGLVAVAGCERDVVIPPDLAWQEPTPPSYLAKPRLAATVNGEDRLAFASLDSLDSPKLYGLAAVGKNPIEGEGPHHLVASSDGRFIYYNLSNYVLSGGSGPHGSHGTGSVPGYLVKLDVKSNLPVAEVLVDRSPGDVIASADGRLLFVSHYDLGRLQSQLMRGAPEAEGYSSVFIIDADSLAVLSQTPVCPTGHGQGLSPDGKLLYLTCTQSDELAVLEVSDARRPRILAKVKVGPAPGPLGNPAYAPYALAVHPSGTVWISNNASKDVRAFDPATLRMDPRAVVSVGGVAMFADYSFDGKWLYVPHQGDDRVTAIELATLRTAVLPLPADACLSAHALRVLPGPPAGAVVVCEGDHLLRKGTLVYIDLPPDLTGWSVRGHVEVGLFPDGVTLLPALGE